MTTPVVEVGPETVHGPGVASPQQVSTALNCIDDPTALLEERVVDVDALWRDVLRAAAAECGATVVIVVPTWWPPGRVEVLTAAGRDVFTDVVVVTRSILARHGEATVVELSADYAVVTPPSSDALVLTRYAPEVEAHLVASSSVLLDVPAGVAPMCAEVTARLRRQGIPVVHSTHSRIRDAATQALPDGGRRDRVHPVPGRRAIAVMAGLALTAAAVGGGWAAQGFAPESGPDDSTRLLTEGRVAVNVPAAWSVERITGGTGSARVRVAPQGGLPALHITQSAGSADMTLDRVAETLRQAIDAETAGVFVDFDADGERAGRPAVTYVERRAGTQTRWAVLVDGSIRIAIGCQHPHARRDVIEDVCAEAVRSARALR